MPPRGEAVMQPLGYIVKGEPLVLEDELTHRVINEFTHAIMAIDAAAGRFFSPEAKLALGESTAILRAFVAAHRALQAPHASGPTDLGEHLARVCNALSSARLDPRGVWLILRRCPVRMDAARCWRIGLAVAELIENAARHGLAGREGVIDINLSANGP